MVTAGRWMRAGLCVGALGALALPAAAQQSSKRGPELERGRLAAGDRALRSGEYFDEYPITLTGGERLTLDLRARDFDPYLILVGPDGRQFENDDHQRSERRSLLAIEVPAAGRYRVLVTSYRANATGAYDLTIDRGVASGATAFGAESFAAMTAAGASRTAASRGGRRGRILGVFVGVSDYAGRSPTLRYTADDARRVADALGTGANMSPGDARILTNRQATVANVREAIRELGESAGPDDLFFFFFSGHGNRVARTEFQSADPDGRDETIELYDARITDDEMRDLLGEVRAGASVIVLDACFSGGFSKDIISAPGRMGLFSSEEDVTSGIALKFRAGGYLAQFMAEAIGDRLADEDGDGTITALELSQYVHERYRSEVRGGSGAKGLHASEDVYVRTNGSRAGYQHLVVDRGSIGPYEVLFR